MNIIGSLKDFFGSRIDRTVITDDSLYASFASRRMALYIAKSYLASALSMCEFKTYEGDRSVKGELYYALNISPNPNQNGSQFVYDIVDRYIYDGGALMVQPSKNKNHFYIADSFSPERHPLLENEFASVVVEQESLNQTFMASDCCYFRMENDQLSSIINSMYKDLGTLLASAMQSYKNGNGERFVFTSKSRDSGVREEGIKKQEEINDRLKTFIRNPNGVLPIYEGQHFERLAPNGNASSADVIALKKEIFETTAMALKIPKSMMYGDMTNIDQIMTQFLTFGVDNFANMISKELTRKFYGFNSWDGGKRRVMCDTSRIVHVDMFQVADKLDKLIASGVTSIDEVRNPIGLDALNTDFSNAHWVTKNYSLIQDALAELTSNLKGGENNNAKDK